MAAGASGGNDAPIVITGGSGFVGQAVARALEPRPVRVVARKRPDWLASAPWVTFAEGDVTRPESLPAALAGNGGIVHLVAIISENGKATFDRVIRQGTENLVAAAQQTDTPRLVYISAMGVRHDPAFPYFEAKWQAEQAVKGSGIPWTILRPSVIFGPGDEFINTLADLVRSAPVTPVVGSGKNKFQPVAVGEVAAAIRRVLDDATTVGQTYELGGGETYTFEGMMSVIAKQLGVQKPRVHVPVPLMRAVVSVSKPLPEKLRPPVTPEQLNMLAVDNCTDHSATEELVGHPALRLEDGISYISRS